MSEQLEILKDMVHQVCWNDEKNCLDTMCNGIYEDAIYYLVQRKEAKWIKGKEGIYAVWSDEDLLRT